MDWVNFFLADVQTGVGPFLAIYLAAYKWNPQRVGLALTVGGLAGIVTQTPAGALVDRVRSKRTLIAAGVVALAAGALMIAFLPAFWPVMDAFQMHVVTHWGIEHWHFLLAHPIDLLSVASAALSNLVSNVPAVLLFEPVLKAVPQALRQNAWLALAMSSTFAGNLTVLESVANLIVVENAKREGINVSFREYCKAGVQ